MMNPSRYTTIKIILGYSLLLTILLLGLLFIRREMRALSQSGQQQESIADSLLFLLNEKDRSILQMVQLMNRANEQALSMSEIEKIIAEQDSVFTQQRVQRNVVMKQDTVLALPPRKKFFKRVAEVFAPSKDDTAVLLNTSYEISVDTVLESINPADSLHQRILKANAENRQKQKAQVRRNAAQFKKVNEQLSAKMDSLMTAFEQNLILQTNAMALQEQHVRQRSSKVLGGIAIGAILLSILFIFIIWRDLAQNNRYRRELELANKRAADLLVAREKLMLAITHDIKAPLGSIIGYLELLQQSVNDEKEQSYIANMESSSQHLLKLVTDLLDFHRLDLNKMEINRESFNPYLLLDELARSFMPLMDTKKLRFTIDISSELNHLFISDSLRIRQITTNLLSNAIKFTNQGSVLLEAGYSDSKLFIKIADTGMGMDEQQKKLIFQEFTRLPQAQGQEGFGLGLSIVQKLIQLLDGNIHVESKIGEGTEFFIEIPLYLLPPGLDSCVAEKNDETGKVDKKCLSSMRVLVIDDDKMQLALTSEMLHRQGVGVVCCEQVNELLDALRVHHFDVLLTDIQMPAMSGFDLLKLLRSSNIGQSRDIPVIAVTARSDMQSAEFLKEGFAGCLHKPFTLQELLTIMQQDTVSSSTDVICIEESSNILQNTSTYDFGALTAFADEDETAIDAILTTFREEMNKDIYLLERALRDNDVSLIAGRAHKLLPLSILMKADELVALLTALEVNKGVKIMTEDIQHQTEHLILLLKDCLYQLDKYQTLV